jgi:hypothetical protein
VNYFHVRHIAMLHVAAILYPHISNKWLNAWAQPFNCNNILAILRNLYSRKKLVEDLPNMGRLLGTVDDSLSLKFLKKWTGQDGWTPLEQGIKDDLEWQT